MPLATFVRFRVYFEAGSDPAHETTASQFSDDVHSVDTPAWGRYVQCIFGMADQAGAFTARERGMFGIHWINTTGGALDTSWVTADYTSVESAVQTFWTANASKIPTSMRLEEFRWYSFGPGVVKPNPPARIATITPSAGTGGSGNMRQIAATVTLKTALRRHWGRFYVPMVATIAGQTQGQISDTDVDALASSARTMLTAPGASQGVVPVVWDRNRFRAYGVTEIQVDSVPDIVRRRRPRTTRYKRQYTS